MINVYRMIKSKIYTFVLFCLLPLCSYAQEDEDDGMIQSPSKVDKKNRDYGVKYLEDQFYLGLTYNILSSKASRVVQHGLSHGIHTGIMRDIPLNERRNVGIAVGMGYAYDLVYSNIVVFSENGVRTYQIPDGLKSLNLNKNNFSLHTLEIPLEFRWRTSTAEDHKFWRIYTGMKFGYVLKSKSFYEHNELSTSFSNLELKGKFHTKLYAALGYNAVNFYVQYSLTPLFKNVNTIEGTSLKANILQLGVMFYIL